MDTPQAEEELVVCRTDDEVRESIKCGRKFELIMTKLNCIVLYIL